VHSLQTLANAANNERAYLVTAEMLKYAEHTVHHKVYSLQALAIAANNERAYLVTAEMPKYAEDV
jgi:hypothetical protein